jgi:tetratricopeptide (TPR) repeat protein
VGEAPEDLDKAYEKQRAGDTEYMFLSKARRLNEEGGELAEEGRFAEAEAAYRSAAAARPGWSAPWYNLGLMHKYQGNWEASLACNQRALELSPSDADAWWNLGIAATALSRWDIARKAWRQCEISIPTGDGPIEMNFGHVPIRLKSNSGGEVLWSRRIDPARAVLVSVPLPDSGHRWGDLILHDGAANGYRMLGDQRVPVFDELACLARSSFVTFVVELDATAAALETLPSIADEFGGAAEDWSTSTRILCKECSEGTPGHFHDGASGAPANPHCGLAARDEVHAREILNTWLARSPGSSVFSIRAAEPNEQGS